MIWASPRSRAKRSVFRRALPRTKNGIFFNEIGKTAKVILKANYGDMISFESFCLMDS